MNGGEQVHGVKWVSFDIAKAVGGDLGQAVGGTTVIGAGRNEIGGQQHQNHEAEQDDKHIGHRHFFLWPRSACLAWGGLEGHRSLHFKRIVVLMVNACVERRTQGKA